MNSIISKFLLFIWFIAFCFSSIMLIYSLNRYMNHLSLVNTCNEYVSEGYRAVGSITDVSSYELNERDKTIIIKSVITEEDMALCTVTAGFRFMAAVAVSPILILYNYLAETILF